ncbi:zinc finger BED domain-containing protein RICESLEEPER 2-like [Canna indica]|uniref:Zinc finger BED domain-containing protein RICESLEEPER 2-like n=1 Tax=Canna indica TaxID=4628 RepID=A0AAQ3KTA3_9LILI|nr:zinc finger BED domain-containing protein RICESLEEPER 2-like [Canna indica]
MEILNPTAPESSTSLATLPLFLPSPDSRHCYPPAILNDCSTALRPSTARMGNNMEVEQERIDEAPSTKEGESTKTDKAEAPLPKKRASSKSNHKGDAMTSELEKVLKEWGIERVFSISADNAFSNQKMIDTLRKKFTVTGKVVASGKYMHVRCIAHIFNLVVQEGLNDVKTSVIKIQNAVKYVRSSPARLKKFKECVDSEGMEWSKSLVLDVPTR